MKAKLTITIDEDLVPRAKSRARAEGISLSRFVETSLRQACAEDQESFSERWRGKFVAAERGDERYRALAKKYL